MKVWIKYIVIASLIFDLIKVSAQVCNAAGNVVIYSNYDGSRETVAGRLNIVADANIPNLRIGICSYERVTVNITGPFVGNVTAVRYAGFNAIGNCNCYWPSTPPGCAVTSTITGVPVGIISYCVYPAAPYNDPNGWPNIICAYQCSGGNQGGCNTPAQVVAYFMNVFGGTFRSHTTQYGCWAGATYNISNSGNCCMVVLPIELAFFETELKNEKTEIRWKTLSETNNKHFEIEKSLDAETYQSIGIVNGHGTTKEVNNYAFVDANPSKGVTYYRLKQIDTDGSFSYSAISSVYNEIDQIQFYPNPSDNNIKFEKLHEGDKISIKNLIGEIVLEESLFSDKTLNVSMLSSGTYLLSFNGKTKKLVIIK